MSRSVNICTEHIADCTTTEHRATITRLIDMKQAWLFTLQSCLCGRIKHDMLIIWSAIIGKNLKSKRCICQHISSTKRCSASSTKSARSIYMLSCQIRFNFVAKSSKGLCKPGLLNVFVNTSVLNTFLFFTIPSDRNIT